MRFRFLNFVIIAFTISIFAIGPGEIVINELMWMGTSRSSIDEFIELRNMTGETYEFSATPIEVFFRDSLIFVIDEGSLEPWGYFLISRLSPDNSQLDTPIDYVNDDLLLPNNNSCISLRDGYTLIDQADDCEGSMSAGRYVPGLRWWSMERNNPPGDGTERSSWHYGCLQEGWRDGSIERGTPGETNYKNIPPIPPDSIIRTPQAVGDDSTITLIAYGVRDIDNLPKPVKCFFQWVCDGEVKYNTVDSTMPTYESVLPADTTRPGQIWTARLTLYDDTDSVGYFYSDSFEVHWEKQDIVINEIMWMGSSQSSRGEWVELWNRSDKICDFSQTPFCLWGYNYGHNWVKLFDLDSLAIMPDSFLIIARREQYFCNLAKPPDMIHSRLRLYDTQLQLALYDDTDTTYSWRIDIAGDGDSPLEGHRSTLDSAWYSMSRDFPPLDGRLESSWHLPAFTIGFTENAMERGTPNCFNHTYNSPPVLSEADEMFSPLIGNFDSVFTFRAIYSDADGLPPISIHLLADIDNSGSFSNHYSERIPMTVAEAADTNYSSGVLYEAHPDSFLAQESVFFSFRADDGHTRTLLGNPPYPGPEYQPTLAFMISDSIWNPDTIRDYDPILSPGISVYHTGDGFQDFGLQIILPDSFPFTGEYPDDASGGLTFVNSEDITGGNLYCLSALFANTIDSLDLDDFNQETSRDDVIVDELQYANTGIYNLTGQEIGHSVLPGDLFLLSLRLNPPAWTSGIYRHRRHTIVIQVWSKFSLP